MGNLIYFHWTETIFANEILSSGKFILRNSLGLMHENVHAIKGKFYYMSVARSRNNVYARSVIGSYSSVILTLDGSYFKNRYKISPIDFHATELKYSQKDQIRGETEDRIYSKTPTIPISNRAAAIKQIDIFVGKNPSSVIKTLILNSKLYHIPVYVYTNKNDFILGNTKKSLNLGTFISTLGNSGFNRQLSKPRSFSFTSTDNPFKKWIELVYKSKYNDLSEDAKKLINEGINSNSFIKSNLPEMLLSELENNSFNYTNMDKIVKIWNKNRIENVPEFINFLEKIWRPRFKKNDLVQYSMDDIQKYINEIGMNSNDYTKFTENFNELLNSHMEGIHNYSEIYSIFSKYQKNTEFIDRIKEILDKIEKDISRITDYRSVKYKLLMGLGKLLSRTID